MIDGTKSELWSAAQGAAYTGVSLPTWYRWLRQGRLPAGVRIGANTVRWPRQVIEAWVAAQPSAGRPS